MPSIKDYNYCWGEHGAAGARRATSQKRWHRLGAIPAGCVLLPPGASPMSPLKVISSHMGPTCACAVCLYRRPRQPLRQPSVLRLTPALLRQPSLTPALAAPPGRRPVQKLYSYSARAHVTRTPRPTQVATLVRSPRHQPRHRRRLRRLPRRLPRRRRRRAQRCGTTCCCLARPAAGVARWASG